MYKVKEVQLIKGPLIIHNVLGFLFDKSGNKTSTGTGSLLFKRFLSSATVTKAVRPNHEVSHQYCYMYRLKHSKRDLTDIDTLGKS